MASGFIYEHCFSSYSHNPGTNRYSFEFPSYWIQTAFNCREVQLRKLLITPSARDLTITNIYLRNADNQLNASFNVSLGPNEGMSTFNDRMTREVSLMIQEYRDDHDLPKFGVRDFEFKYNFTKSQLIFNVLSRTDGDGNAYYFYFDDAQSSSDFDAITGVNCTELFKNIQAFQDGSSTAEEFALFLKDHPTVEVWTPEGSTMVQRIIFNNVWSRSTLFVSSSLSELNALHYLGLSNEVYTPPKLYDVKGIKNTLDIHLFNLDQNTQVELPADGKDRITIEVVLSAE